MQGRLPDHCLADRRQWETPPSMHRGRDRPQVHAIKSSDTDEISLRYLARRWPRTRSAHTHTSVRARTSMFCAPCVHPIRLDRIACAIRHSPQTAQAGDQWPGGRAAEISPGAAGVACGTPDTRTPGPALTCCRPLISLLLISHQPPSASLVATHPTSRHCPAVYRLVSPTLVASEWLRASRRRDIKLTLVGRAPARFCQCWGGLEERVAECNSAPSTCRHCTRLSCKIYHVCGTLSVARGACPAPSCAMVCSSSHCASRPPFRHPFRLPPFSTVSGSVSTRLLDAVQPA
jgi:hypothetical protein